MRAENTDRGWLIIDGKRWRGPGEDWKDKPAQCRNFATETAANLQLRRLEELQADADKRLDDAGRGKPVSGKRKR